MQSVRSSIHIIEESPTKRPMNRPNTLDDPLSNRGDEKTEKQPSTYSTIKAPRAEGTFLRNQQKYEELQREIYEYKLLGSNSGEEYCCFCFPIGNK